jgi:hypothetical protein
MPRWLVGGVDRGVKPLLLRDLPAIVAAHALANAHNLPVRSKPTATYHLGRQAFTAIIETDTDWNTSQFIVDDSQEGDDTKRPLASRRAFPR